MARSSSKSVWIGAAIGGAIGAILGIIISSRRASGKRESVNLADLTGISMTGLALFKQVIEAFS